MGLLLAEQFPGRLRAKGFLRLVFLLAQVGEHRTKAAAECPFEGVLHDVLVREVSSRDTATGVRRIVGR